MTLPHPHSDVKVFGIGLQKTGLTSLLTVMRQAGFTSCGHDSTQRKNFFRGRHRSILDYYDTADFFCDWPTPLMYKRAFEKYGTRARFILTERRDARTWYESVKRHNAYAHPLKNKHRLVFGRYYPHGFDAEHIAFYERHGSDARAFFESHNAGSQLLTLRVDEPNALAKVEAFLGVSTGLSTFAHRNDSRTSRAGLSNHFKLGYNTLIHPIYERVAPLFRPGPARHAQVVEMTDAITD